MAPLPTVAGRVDLLLAVAAVSRSGRVRDCELLTALGWQPGDRTAVELLDSTIRVRHDPRGRYAINDRGQVFLPVGARKLLGISANTQVALIAFPEHDALLVHPCPVVTAVLAGFFEALTGAPYGR
ncbi:hypothetical protein HFP15_41755 [Amycolatopsis sp. K13G38]|uniref:AbrB/MazE/SpoVT family DNA-binding domain-containing protein n=1 Tax=Amycolatopsis acididurans TaxID=2724524 RepID=A0ABX1JIE7_9PSEU|nr:hypothetical protein [Amycolatopsis acididurans]NKQ59378.1 hypothetical protein [Amycolatopsis acididurans]